MAAELIISAVVLAVIFLLEGIFPYFPGRTHRLRHAIPNLLLAALAGVVGGLATSKLVTGGETWAECCPFGLLNRVSFPPLVAALFAFVLFDLWMYLWHTAVHRVHHVDTGMDSTTAFRFHPIEVALTAFLRVGVLILLGMSVTQLFIYVVIFHPVILFHHSNLALPEKWDRRFRGLIATPNMHRVHHSIVWEESNSNYGSVFSFWDRLARTFRERGNTLTITYYGLREFRGQEWTGLWSLLRIPFLMTDE